MGRTACTEPQYLYKGDLYFYLTLILVGTVDNKCAKKLDNNITFSLKLSN